MPPKRFTDEIETKICNEYKEGKNGVHLGYKYKCDPSIIYRVLKENNIPRINGKRLIKQEKETEICKKYLRWCKAASNRSNDDTITKILV
jgi:Mor family transcriptional regulator